MVSSTAILSSSCVSCTWSEVENKDRRRRDCGVYVAAVPLTAAKGPPQLLLSAAYSVGVLDLQHYMVIVNPSQQPSQAFVFDFQPEDPESIKVALAALSGHPVPGVVLKRRISRLPKSRCWFAGHSHSNSIEAADQFSDDWNLDLIVGKRDCRHFTESLVFHLTGKQHILDQLRGN